MDDKCLGKQNQYVFNVYNIENIKENKVLTPSNEIVKPKFSDIIGPTSFRLEFIQKN